jgi:FkbM family methyltransferase
MPGYDKICKIETIFGKYKFIGDNYGYSILSPAFERPDKEYFITLMKASLHDKKSVLFLDVGAYVGDYSIGIYRCIKNNSVTTVAFEPDIDYYKLLLTNVRDNGVPKFKAYNIGLSNKNTTIRVPRFPTLVDIIPSKVVTFRLRRLDDVLPATFYNTFDEIFVKIDIEGHEEETFDGARNLTESSKKIRLMIEDCVNPSISEYLSAHKWKFMTKITPYDSFWELN